MATQVFNENNELVMQRNATRNGAAVTVFTSVDLFFNNGDDSLECTQVTLEDGRSMLAFEALNELSNNNWNSVTFKNCNWVK